MIHTGISSLLLGVTLFHSYEELFEYMTITHSMVYLPSSIFLTLYFA